MKTIDLHAEQTTAVALTRKEKLLRWAELVRAAPQQLPLFNLLERWPDEMLRATTAGMGCSAFTIAAADEVFKAAGLRGDSVRDSMDFFELTQSELHEFSCDCGGAISNSKMAGRIADIAHARPPSMFGRMGSFLR